MHDLLVGRYRLGAELGRGGMARVFRARDLRLHRDVAVKLVELDPSTMGPDVRGRFVREARSAAAFTHPHAVSVFDAGEADGVLYLVMELIDGPSLATILARDGPLGIDRARAWVDQVLQALSAAHRAGIVHRDVKAGNVLVTADGVAKLSDFGIAKRLDDLGADLTMPGRVVGTPSSMAPEQVTGGPATPATDVYAAGVLLFQVLVNGPPFDAGSAVATALAHRDAPVPDVRERRPDVPVEMAALIRRAMAKDPADRFGSADAMRRALAAPPSSGTQALPHGSFDAPDERTSVATAVLPTARAATRPRVWWWWLALGIVAASAVAVGILGRGGDPRSAAPAASTDARTSVTARPAPTASTPVTTTMPPPLVTSPATPPGTATPVPTMPVEPTTVAELIAAIEDGPEQFGPHAAELLRDLERIAERDGRQLERDVQRLSGRVADWTADGTIAPEVATSVDSALAAVIEADEDQGDG